MTNRKLRRTLGICAVLLVLTLVGGLTTTSLANPVSQPATNSGYLPLTQRAEPGKIYLPLVMNGAPTVTSFGVQAQSTYNPLLKPLNLEWLRLDGPSWSDVQTTEGGGYNWDAESVRRFDRALQGLQRTAISPRVIMIVNGSPEWATADGNKCRAIEPDHFDDFARFMEAVARRYPTVKYLELGNESDVDPSLVPRGSGFGCWGDQNDEFYGGRTYGEMLKVVYPAIKGVSGSIQVLNGGLLLDRPYDAATGSGLPARFMEGVFAAGAGSSFDIMNYHSYTFYNGTIDGDSAVDPAAIDWKPRYLRELMQRYGVAEKPLINTEGALLCTSDEGEHLNACHDAQASMIVRLYARAARDGLTAVIWYIFDSDGFHSTGLVVRSENATRPAYHAFKHARSLFGGARYLGTLDNQAEGVEGYRFQNGSLDVTVFWSDQSDKTASIPVPAGSTPRCTDRVGTSISCQNNNGVVILPATSQPTYVVIP